MGRISISIPDKLMAKLEPLKEGINISQLCREALERRIDAYERASRRNGHELDIEALVQRLREESALVEGKFELLGKKNAAEWLSAASYLEFKNLAEANNSYNMHKYQLPRAAFRTMKLDMAEADATCDGIQSVVYKTAWLDYVRAVWSQIAGQLHPEDSKEPVEVPEEVGVES